MPLRMLTFSTLPIAHTAGRQDSSRFILLASSKKCRMRYLTRSNGSAANLVVPALADKAPGFVCQRDVPGAGLLVEEARHFRLQPCDARQEQALVDRGEDLVGRGASSSRVFTMDWEMRAYFVPHVYGAAGRLPWVCARNQKNGSSSE
jgi:hypothetical protein